jgi:hypothetical protein
MVFPEKDEPSPRAGSGYLGRHPILGGHHDTTGTAEDAPPPMYGRRGM